MGLGRIVEVSLFTHHPPGSPWERAEHRDIWRAEPPKRQSLFAQHFFTFFLFAYFFCHEQIDAWIIKYQPDCLRCFSVSWRLRWSSITEETCSLRAMFCLHLTPPSNLYSAPVFVQLAWVWFTFSKPLSSPPSSPLYDDLPLALVACAKLHLAAKKTSDSYILLIWKVRWNPQLHTFLCCFYNFWAFHHDAHVFQVLNHETAEKNIQVLHSSESSNASLKVIFVYKWYAVCLLLLLVLLLSPL